LAAKLAVDGLAADAHRLDKMSRLTRYLVRLFTVETVFIFLIAMILIWLMQLLRSFDLVAVKGQDMLTLAGQSLLVLPQIGKAILFVAMGIGMARGLNRLQTSQELHSIHANGRMASLLKAAAIFAAGGALVMLVISNWIEPAANRQLSDWNESIAADLVSRAVVPDRFAEVAPDVVIHIGGRGENGRIDAFFADDRRDPEVRRTYFADTAQLIEDDRGYVLRLIDGRMQYAPRDGRFAEIAFGRYDIMLDTLTESGEAAEPEARLNSLEIIMAAVVSGQWSVQALERLLDRLVEGLRVIGLCLVVTAIAAFPHARRRGRHVPLEIVVIVVAVAERLIWLYVPGRDVLAQAGTALVLVLAGVALLVFQLKPAAALLARRTA
jgi:lipopolysaccharide export system permease protein